MPAKIGVLFVCLQHCEATQTPTICQKTTQRSVRKSAILKCKFHKLKCKLRLSGWIQVSGVLFVGLEKARAFDSSLYDAPTGRSGHFRGYRWRKRATHCTKVAISFISSHFFQELQRFYEFCCVLGNDLGEESLENNKKKTWQK